jgi:DNA-binding transcriptional ArsR family regulator
MILTCIKAAGPISVTDIGAATGINDTTVSQTLRYLRAGQIVATERAGRIIRYRLCQRCSRGAAGVPVCESGTGPAAVLRQQALLWSARLAADTVEVVLVQPLNQGGCRKREPGANPGLPRSGERERPPSSSTGLSRLGSDGQ